MKGNETIYLWIYQKEDQKHRLYQFPYTRDAAKKLAEAGEDAKKGVEISGEMAEGPSGSGQQIRIELYPTRPNMIVGPVKN
jgi:IS30 family transposase